MAPQADPPLEATAVETMNKPEAATTATSTVNLPPWQSHLQGMDPTDAQAFMACSAASLGVSPRLYLDETPVKSAAPRAMFEDDLHDELKEREMGADKAEKSRGAEASQRRVSTAIEVFLRYIRRDSFPAIPILLRIWTLIISSHSERPRPMTTFRKE